MKPKSLNTFYWICTFLFSALMIFSAWSSIIVNEDSVKLIHGMLGYPVYFIPFTGWAKLIGSVVILIPGYSRLKEWAYAGLFFDLAAAIYSGIAIAKKVDPLMLTLLIWIVPGIVSYVLWHKKMELANKDNERVQYKRKAVLS